MQSNFKIFSLAALLLALSLGATAENEHLRQGNWEGSFTSGEWENSSFRSQIVAMGGGVYRAYLYFPQDGGEELRVEAKGRDKDDVTGYETDVDLGAALGGGYTLTGMVKDEVFSGTLEGKSGKAEFELKRVVLGSPTLGQAPPEGAVVLMNGKDLEPMHVQPHWIVDGDGAAHISGSSIESKEEFGSAQYHIEFRTPFMPGERGQGRGNSGVYLMGRYELQVLDSFTDEPMDNLCGGIYQKAIPTVMACHPPLEWQTYDITFTAPAYDADGNKTGDARITVVQNGTTIHDDVVLPDVTPGGVSGTEAPMGPLMLQDHHDTVSYRNVWVKSVD